MGLIKHVNILAALEMRALRYHNKGHVKADTDKILHDEAMEKTGTIHTSGLSDFDADALGDQYQKILTATTLEMEEIMEIADEILKVHGVDPGRKAEGLTRVIYDNSDGLNNRIGGNRKLEKAKEIIYDLEADVVMINEHRMNCSHKDNRNRLS